jgi:putative SOS response-associated peptidase YedK
LWDIWHAPDGFTLRSCTILVGPANELVSTVHDRMPLILPDSAYRMWLDPATPLAAIRSLLQPLAPDQLRGWPVTPAVNQARNDYRELITPLD